MSGIEQVTWNITCTDTFKSKLLSLRAEILGYLFGEKKKKNKEKKSTAARYRWDDVSRITCSRRKGREEDRCTRVNEL